ncbi:MAG: hypothetical protein ABSD78_16095 [Acidimicrobiales bacterium]
MSSSDALAVAPGGELVVEGVVNETSVENANEAVGEDVSRGKLLIVEGLGIA